MQAILFAHISVCLSITCLVHHSHFNICALYLLIHYLFYAPDQTKWCMYSTHYPSCCLSPSLTVALQELLTILQLFSIVQVLTENRTDVLQIHLIFKIYFCHNCLGLKDLNPIYASLTTHTEYFLILDTELFGDHQLALFQTQSNLFADYFCFVCTTSDHFRSSSDTPQRILSLIK